MYQTDTATLADLLQMQRQQMQTCRRADSMPGAYRPVQGAAGNFAGPVTACVAGQPGPQYASAAPETPVARSLPVEP